ncbi:hypothetical protein P389DRAFT_205404 [Cystobasidium minutum MCA 4210]|uniref:uncharacterized protein n=1 Tax=Cystobasidium minutum MCA 4210 TaxID=1397322 RepID=UPI0034CE559C|eukprot:jgi/Rhomi1/205404/MIX6233_540_32
MPGLRSLPHSIGSVEVQKQRVLARLREKATPLDQYEYLVSLQHANTDLFFRTLMDNVRELMPLVYTPTIGSACLRYSHLFSYVSNALFLSYNEKGRIAEILDSLPDDFEISVVTDGSRILGLGDLGVDGVGIPMGKLALYSACAGIHPSRTLPVVFDVGTNNAQKLHDPLYVGLRQNRITPDEEKEFIDEFMQAVQKRWPGMVVQFEDFSTELAFDLLATHREKYPTFNDDIQGTAAVSLAGFINAIAESNTPLPEHKIVFFGAGSAAVGIAELICQYFVQQGVPKPKAKDMITLVDSKGLVADNRGDQLPVHKRYFSKSSPSTPRLTNLQEVVEHIKPTALLGLSTVKAAFSEDIIRFMAKTNERPIIFALSNPLTQAECTFEEAIQWTDGKALFASGSPFADVHWHGKTLINNQGNNVYIFPGLGLGAILAKCATIPEDLIHTSANALAQATTEEEKAQFMMYPRLERIREVSGTIAFKVIRKCQELGIARNDKIKGMSDKQLHAYIHQNMYDPLSTASGDAKL